MPSEAGLNILLRAIKYSFTTCPSDNYLFHRNLIKNMYFKNTPAPTSPGKLNGDTSKRNCYNYLWRHYKWLHNWKKENLTKSKVTKIFSNVKYEIYYFTIFKMSNFCAPAPILENYLLQMCHWANIYMREYIHSSDYILVERNWRIRRHTRVNESLKYSAYKNSFKEGCWGIVTLYYCINYTCLYQVPYKACRR